MRKLIVLLVLVGILALSVNAFAEEARTITRKSVVVTDDTVVSTQGVTVYSITGYANASNSVFGLYNSSTLVGALNATVKAEAAEATQYDSWVPITYEKGLEFPDGLTVVTMATNSAFVVIEYE